MSKDGKGVFVAIDKNLWTLFGEVAKGRRSQIIEGMIEEYLGISCEGKRNEIYLKKRQHIQLGEEISKLEKDIQNTENIQRDKLKTVWKDFRKRFTVRQEGWENDDDIVEVLKRDYGIIISYKRLFEVWDNMEELNE